LDDLAEAVHQANPGGDAAFEFGLHLIINGLAHRSGNNAAVRPETRPRRVERTSPLKTK
jgi:hypothetical protein